MVDCGRFRICPISTLADSDGFRTPAFCVWQNWWILVDSGYFLVKIPKGLGLNTMINMYTQCTCIRNVRVCNIHVHTHVHVHAIYIHMYTCRSHVGVMAERSSALDSSSGVVRMWVRIPAWPVEALKCPRARHLTNSFVLRMGRKTVGPVCCVMHVKEPRTLIVKEKGLASVFLDSRLEHPAGWICARYKSSVLLLFCITCMRNVQWTCVCFTV